MPPCLCVPIKQQEGNVYLTLRKDNFFSFPLPNRFFVLSLDKIGCISTKKIKVFGLLFCFVFDLHYLCPPNCGHITPATVKQAMGTYINRGNIEFRDIVSHEYVDKTSLIPLINARLNSESRYSCVTRCRRFGKSMAAKMLFEVGAGKVNFEWL